MTQTNMALCNDFYEFLNVMDSFVGHLKTNKPPERPTDHQYEDVLLHTLSPECERYSGTRRHHEYFWPRPQKRPKATSIQWILNTGEIIPKTVNSNIRAYSVINNATKDSTCALGSERRMGVAKEAFSVRITKLPFIARYKIRNLTIVMSKASVATF